MKTNEKYIAPESQELMVRTEGCIATSDCEGYTQGDLGCSSESDCDYD